MKVGKYRKERRASRSDFLYLLGFFCKEDEEYDEEKQNPAFRDGANVLLSIGEMRRMRKNKK